jgi:hypothetical protein
VTRASRARMRAVGAQRRTLYGVVSSAYDSGRDGRLSRMAHLTQNQRPIARRVSQILQDNRAPDVRLPNSDTRGVNDPRRVRVGATVADLYRGRSRPAFPSTIWARTWRTAQGAVRSLCVRPPKFLHFSVLAAARAQGPTPNLAVRESLSWIARGTTSKF